MWVEKEREVALAKGDDDLAHRPVKQDLIFEKLSQHLGIFCI